jgi:hypothetical protein
VETVAAERLQLSYAAGAIAISKAIWRTVEDVHDLRLDTLSRQAEVIPLGLPDVDGVPVEPISLEPASGPVFLFVGRLEARKGIEELGEAFARIARLLPTATLWIAGADNSANDGFAHRTGVTYPDWLRGRWGPETAGRIRIFGPVSEAVKNYLFSRCDVFVGPSRYESFGLVFLEAMRWGKPVIATNVGGVPEVVTDGETGLLVPGQSVEALVEAMARLGRDALLRKNLGEAGRRHFVERFSVRRCALATELFYYRILSAWDGRSCPLHTGRAALTSRGEARTARQVLRLGSWRPEEAAETRAA